MICVAKDVNALRRPRTQRCGEDRACNAQRPGGSLRGAPLEHHHRQLGYIAFEHQLVAVLRSGLLHHSNPAGALDRKSVV